MPLHPLLAATLGVRRTDGYMQPNARRDDPLAWLYRLEHRLQAETAGRVVLRADGTFEWRIGLSVLDAYYSGEHPLPEIVDDETKDRFLTYMQRSRSNYMQPVVDSEAQRLHWQGVRIGSDRDAKPDEQTWDIMEKNGVDSLFTLATQVALTQRRAYWSVWYPRKGEETPRIAVEDPCQVLVEYEPGDRRRRAAGLKVWVDEWTGSKAANVYLPGGIYKYIWHEHEKGRPAGWYPREDPERNPLGVVPLIPMVNRPTLNLDPDGRSELDTVIPIQDRINQTILNRQVAEHFSAFRQKWATGIAIPEGEDGEPIAEFKAAIDTFWVNSDPAGRWGEFAPTDLTNYNAAKESDVQDIAILSATPRHYFTVNGQAPSGDSMKSAEAALVAKCVDFQKKSGNPALREVTHLARKIADLPDAEITPIWGDPEYQTYGQLVDGTVKLVQERIISRAYAREVIGIPPTMAARIAGEILAEESAMQREMVAQAAAMAATQPANPTPV